MSTRKFRSDEERIARLLLAAALMATATGLVLGIILPASRHVIAVGSALCGLATWVVPLFIWQVLSWRQTRGGRRPTSLASAGLAISFMVLALLFSVVTVSLAILVLVLGQGGVWAWLALLEIVAFWVLGGVWLNYAHRSSPARQRSE